MDTNLSKLWETEKDRGAWSTAVHGVAKGQTRLMEINADCKKMSGCQGWEWQGETARQSTENF